MIVYPAIDLRAGKVVRLKHGDPSQQTVFSEDPLSTAKRWIDEGASWLHMVNLDGAFETDNDNLRVMEQVAGLNVKMQFGGGLRDMQQIARAIDAGASRLVLGTVAVKQPETVKAAIDQFGAEAVCVGLDAKNGKITTHGWQSVTEQTPTEFASKLEKLGVKHGLYTDVSRDGTLEGVNIESTIALAEATHIQIIASGGVSSLQDIEQLATSGKVAGAIVGMALYTGQFSLQDALRIAEGDRHAR